MTKRAARTRQAGREWFPALCGLLMAAAPAASRADAGMYDALSRLPLAFTETFETNPPAGWQADGTAEWTARGGRLVLNLGSGASVWLYRSVASTDSFAEVECSQAGAPLSPAGLVMQASPDFHAASGGSAFLCLIRKEGSSWQYGVLHRDRGEELWLKPWTGSRVIKSGGNRLSALCFNGLLQFYINEQLVWEGYHEALPAGSVGLYGAVGEERAVTHTFDNLQLRLVSGSTTEPPAPPPPAPPTVPAVNPVAAPKNVEPPKNPEPPAATNRVVEPPPAVPEKVETPDKGEDPGGQPAAPKLRAGLQVRLSVYVSGKPEIDAKVTRVSDNNQLDLPLVGMVDVGGMTLRDLNAALQTRYRDFFVNPQVMADFMVDDNPDAISPWGSVDVQGRVKKTGPVNIPPTQDLTVSKAIQLAGGFDTSPKMSAIELTRHKAAGGTERILIDFTEVDRKGSPGKNLVLKPGDQIFVPERVW